MKLPSYAKYVVSRDAWVGLVPAGWRLLRADFTTTSHRNQISDTAMAGREVLYYSIPNVQEFGTAQVEDGNDIDSSKLLITKKQLLVSKLNPRKATVCIAEPHATLLTVCSGEFVPIVPEGDLNLRYCYYTWLSDKVTKLLSSRVQSVTRSHQRVSPEDITKLPWAWPPAEEQQRIAAFLDWKTAKIDRLIAWKEELLGKLKEKRLAIITHAVTHGLNPAGRVRDSGTPWLGKLPEHWEVIPLGFLVTMSGGLTPSTVNAEFWEGDIPWVTPKDMKQPRISDSIDRVTQKALEETAISLIPVNAVLIVVRGMILAHSFPTAVNETPVTINQDMKALRAGEKLEVEYLFWTLTGFAKVFSGLAQESAHGTRKIETETIKKFPFPVPPKDEQRAITRQLDGRLRELDALSLATERTIERLTEYRTSLISAATIGKIDVRNVQIPETAA